MNTPGDAARVLLVASNVPPVCGGSAIVYDSLARHAGGAIQLLAPRRSYLDGLAMIGWREHDRRASYPVTRLDLLRTLLHGALPQGTGPHSTGPDGVARRRVGLRAAWSRAAFLAGDLHIRWRLARTVLWLVLRGPVRAVCVGELLSSGWLLLLLRRLIRLGLPLRLVAYVHGEEITTIDPYDPGRRRCRAALEAADRIVVVSRFTLDAVHALLGPGVEARTCLIGNGVDTERFRPGPRRADLVEQYGLAGCLVFVSVCRLLEKKGLDQAIRALARLAPGGPAARLLVVGMGQFEPELRRIAAEVGVAGAVVFAGPVAEAELAAHYRLGDVFVMPNRALSDGDTEGFGLVFLEANACGLPVIAGRDGGSSDAVRDGENGLVVDGRSVEAVAAAMQRLAEDEALRRALAAEGLRVAAASGWAAKTRAFLETCEADGAATWRKR